MVSFRTAIERKEMNRTHRKTTRKKREKKTLVPASMYAEGSEEGTQEI